MPDGVGGAIGAETSDPAKMCGHGIRRLGVQDDLGAMDGVEETSGRVVSLSEAQRFTAIRWELAVGQAHDEVENAARALATTVPMVSWRLKCS